MKQFLHSYVISLIFLSDSAASFLFKLLSENRRRFASKVGHLRYFMGLSCKVKSPWRIAARSALARPARTILPLRR